MNAFANQRPLLLGIGNVLRSDDGLGRVVVEQLARTGELDGEILSIHQLTPELALPMAEASLVVIIDASREGRPGEVRVLAEYLGRRVSLADGSGTAVIEDAAIEQDRHGEWAITQLFLRKPKTSASPAR